MIRAAIRRARAYLLRRRMIRHAMRRYRWSRRHAELVVDAIIEGARAVHGAR